MKTYCWMTLVASSRPDARHQMMPGIAVFLLPLVLLLGACSDPQPTRLQGATMGTSYSVVIPHLPEGVTASQLKQEIDGQLELINQQMSTYIPNSELSAVNQAGPDQWLPLSDELYAVLELAQSVSEKSQGAFDITVGPLVNLWGFGPVEQGVTMKQPAEEDVAAARKRIGYQNIELDRGQVSLRKKVAGLYIDLSGIAKGYGVDVLADYLDAVGIQSYLVEIGGELRARGESHRGDSWRIALEKPLKGERDIQHIIPLDNIAVATSGDYRNYVEFEGKRYSHTIDPLQGKPIDHRLASVTVLAERADMADAWATALMVLGEEAGFALAMEQDLAAYFLYKEKDDFVAKETPAFTRLTAPRS